MPAQPSRNLFNHMQLLMGSWRHGGRALPSQIRDNNCTSCMKPTTAQACMKWDVILPRLCGTMELRNARMDHSSGPMACAKVTCSKRVVCWQLAVKPGSWEGSPQSCVPLPVATACLCQQNIGRLQNGEDNQCICKVAPVQEIIMLPMPTIMS